MQFPTEQLFERLEQTIVGLRREAEVLGVALATGRHIVLEGPHLPTSPHRCDAVVTRSSSQHVMVL